MENNKDKLMKETLKEELKEYDLSDEEIKDLMKLEGEIAQLMLVSGMTYEQAEEYIADCREEYSSYHYY